MQDGELKFAASSIASISNWRIGEFPKHLSRVKYRPRAGQVFLLVWALLKRKSVDATQRASIG
jgi:hypothetical protein